jgi:hypothetical protein
MAAIYYKKERRRKSKDHVEKLDFTDSGSAGETVAQQAGQHY